MKSAIGDLVRFVEASGLLAYAAYINDDGTPMTVLQAHPDSVSMELHMRVATPAFRKFIDLIRPSTTTSMVSRVPNSWS